MYVYGECLQEKLVSFILACQDDETGGFADRPGDMVSTRAVTVCNILLTISF